MDGSNQLGAIVTWKATVSSPVGCVDPGRAAASSSTAAALSDTASERRMVAPPGVTLARSLACRYVTTTR